MNTKTLRIILASGSPRRKELLEQIGIDFEVRPGTKEEVIAGEGPEEITRLLALQKAEEAAQECLEDAIIIGADTIVLAGGEILGKPKSLEDAKRMLRLLSDGVHEVYTGVALIRKGRAGTEKITFAEKTEVYVYPISDGEIDGYLALGESMDKAGAYGIQGRFGAFIRKIEGSYSNVVGLPAGRVYQELKALMEK